MAPFGVYSLALHVSFSNDNFAHEELPFRLEMRLSSYQSYCVHKAAQELAILDRRSSVIRRPLIVSMACMEGCKEGKRKSLVPNRWKCQVTSDINTRASERHSTKCSQLQHKTNETQALLPPEGTIAKSGKVHFTQSLPSQ